MNRNYLFKCPSLGLISIALFLFASIAFADVVVKDSKVKAKTPNFSMTKPMNVLYNEGQKIIMASDFTEDKSIKRITDEEGLDYAHPFVALI